MARHPNADRTLSRQAMKAEMLDAETETALAHAWRDERDEAALHRLTTAHLRLAISVAARFRRYGAPMADLIQEAGLGLMKAADKFDPDRGVRFSTYAVWWIRASVQDCVMRNWSMVRTGSTSTQKSLFFNLRRVQARLEREAMQDGVALDGYQMREQIAREVGVALRDIEVMQGRLAGPDFSLNAPQSAAGEGGREWIELIEDRAPQAVETVTRRADTAKLRGWLVRAMRSLNSRERHIVTERRLSANPRTLENLGTELGLSKERVRQLEVAAFARMRKVLEGESVEVRALLR